MAKIQKLRAERDFAIYNKVTRKGIKRPRLEPPPQPKERKLKDPVLLPILQYDRNYIQESMKQVGVTFFWVLLAAVFIVLAYQLMCHKLRMQHTVVKDICLTLALFIPAVTASYNCRAAFVLFLANFGAQKGRQCMLIVILILVTEGPYRNFFNNQVKLQASLACSQHEFERMKADISVLLRAPYTVLS